MNELTLSVVSHGHGPLLDRLLRELAAQASLAGSRVVVTLNLPGEPFEPASCEPLDAIVIRNDVPRGFGANHNAAFLHCSTPWFGMLNSNLGLDDGEPFTCLIRGGTEAASESSRRAL